MFKIKATSMNYSIEVTIDDFLSVHKYENALIWEDELEGKCIYLMLEELDGIRDIDYDCHFGEYFYLTIEKEYDNIGTWNEIYKIIGRQIEVAREYVRESKQREEQ
jgi:hypothetical protein